MPAFSAEPRREPLSYKRAGADPPAPVLLSGGKTGLRGTRFLAVAPEGWPEHPTPETEVCVRTQTLSSYQPQAVLQSTILVCLVPSWVGARALGHPFPFRRESKAR